MVNEKGFTFWTLSTDVIKPKNKETSSLNSNTNIRLTDELVVKRIYILAEVISQVFEEINMHYWTSGGTTLGIERHQGLIPWDDDIDICILDTSVELLLSN